MTKSQRGAKPSSPRKKSPLKTAAVLKITKAHLMSQVGRFVIARWMREQASRLEKQGQNYDSNYRATYQYR